MKADGEVRDFTERDALHYVVYDLEPLVRTPPWPRETVARIGLGCQVEMGRRLRLD